MRQINTGTDACVLVQKTMVDKFGSVVQIPLPVPESKCIECVKIWGAVNKE